MKKERHHILYNRHAWTANKDLEALREDKRLIVPLDHDAHSELHRRVSHVPPISYHMARRVLRNFTEYGDDTYLHNLESLQFSIEEAMKHPRADRIERGVGALAVHALDMQKPFVDDSGMTYLIKYGRLAEVHHEQPLTDEDD